MKLEISFQFQIFFFLGGGGILSLRQVCFFEISITFPICNTLYDLLQENKHLNFRHKNQKDRYATKKCFFWNSLRYLSPIQNYMYHCQLKISLDPTLHLGRLRYKLCTGLICDKRYGIRYWGVCTKLVRYLAEVGIANLFLSPLIANSLINFGVR